jgi:hypothetical protein
VLPEMKCSVHTLLYRVTSFSLKFVVLSHSSLLLFDQHVRDVH